MRLGVNVRHAEEQLRGTLALPNGLGKSITVAVFAEGDAARAANEAGADFVGAQELADRVAEGWTDFDVAIATPALMGPVVPSSGACSGRRARCRTRRWARSPTTSPRRSRSPRPARSSTAPTARGSSI